MLGHAPLHRSARTGAILLVLGVLIFVAMMFVTQFYYSTSYSLTGNYISDLGNTSTSPMWYLFSVGIIALGVLALVGILLLWSTFPAGGTRVLGLTLLLIASVAAILIGFFPENVNSTVHAAASLAVFLPSGVGLLVLGLGMRERTGWSALRGLSVGLGVVVLVFLAVFLFRGNLGVDAYLGLWERLVVFPVLLWGIVVGIFVARFPVRARAVGHLVPGA